MLRHYRFHRLVYRICHTLISPILLKKYSFTTDRIDSLDGPYLIMSNHTTEVDMAMLMNAVKPHQYFVCGEHLIRSKKGSRIVSFFNPIPEFKGASAMKTVIEILRRIKEGANVMIFPEGSRSFNGETVSLPVSAGKLVKTARCGLVTYRIEGGYFVAPRWAYRFRTGHMEGHVVHIYTKDELAAMTPQEITDHINADIYEHAYETQKQKMIPFTGKGLAEGIENYLIICPECGSYDSLDSENDAFWCTCCGAAGTYDEYGFLHGDKIHFNSVYDWGKWIEKKFAVDMKDKTTDELLFEEESIHLYQITDDHHQVDLETGTLQIFKNRLEMCGKTFAFQDISALSLLYFGKTLLFTHNGIHYGMTGERFHAWKASQLYESVER